MTAALETIDLGRRYGTKWGLRHCTISVPEGQVTGLVGPNGAGKSTLLRLAAGLSRPTTGTVSIFGEKVNPNGTAHLSRMGYFDQLRPLYGAFRVEEMLTLGRRLNREWDDRSTRAWLSELDISLSDRVSKLSVGQQAQVALTVCMGKKPDLLLLDEPVASLDPLARRQLLQTLLGTVAERRATVLLSSHIVSELEPLCENLIILSSSAIHYAGTLEGLLGEHHLVSGPRGETLDDVEIISETSTGRQTTFLVRSARPITAAGWRVVEPDLEEIVLAYLARPVNSLTAPSQQGAVP